MQPVWTCYRCCVNTTCRCIFRRKCCKRRGPTEPRFRRRNSPDARIAGRIVIVDDLANSGRFQRWRDLNIEMLSNYRRRDWTAALETIERGRNADDEQRFKTLYDVYAARVRAFQITPPPEDWDGAYALESK